MRVRKDFWQSPKLEKIALAIFIFLLPSQLAYHFWPQFSYVFGLRVDYLAPTVYLTDLLFALLLPYLVFRLRTFFKLKYSKRKLSKVFKISVVFLTYIIINIVLADSPVLSFSKWLIILKLILVGSYFYTLDLKCFTKLILSTLTVSVIFFSTVGVVQFIAQRTIGFPFNWLGERSFTMATPSIALVELSGKNLMRAYSTFPHPNSLAGYLIVVVLIIWGLGKRVGFWLLVPIIAIVLSFSRSAWISAGVIATLFSVKNLNKSFSSKLFKITPLLLVIISFSVFLFPDISVNMSRSLSERRLLGIESLKVFSANPIFGVGLNNSLINPKIVQPVHNVYLLVATEMGVVGLVVVFLFINLWFKNIKNKYFLLAFIFVILTATIDHYWFTLQQNQLLLSLLIGLSLNERLSKNI